MQLDAIQAALRQAQLDGWLFYDHHHRDPIAYRILGLSDNLHITRRWYYFVPAAGEPRKLVHRIESLRLDPLPGRAQVYSSWQELEAALRQMLTGAERIAMQYSPRNAIMYVSMVDAGTIEVLRELGKTIVSSADLVSRFEAVLTPEQEKSHYEAQAKIDAILDAGFQEIGRRVRSGDFLLIDIWARPNRDATVFYDITWTGVVEREPTLQEQAVFDTVRNARDAAIAKVKRAFAVGKPIAGWEADDAARAVIRDAGYAEFFTHRTGHNIGTDLHGNGAHLDNLETHDERLLLPHTCFSVEPGIYLKDFGIRSEVNMITGDHEARVTGRLQTELVRV